MKISTIGDRGIRVDVSKKEFDWLVITMQDGTEFSLVDNKGIFAGEGALNLRSAQGRLHIVPMAANELTIGVEGR